MTRFARARGSKSSNERTPEDSTPWEVMKEQLIKAKKDSEDSEKREQAEKQRIENYENFLRENKVQKRKATWCDFPDSQVNILNNSSSELIKRKKKKQNAINQSISMTEHSQQDSKTAQNRKKLKKKTKLKNKDTSESESQVPVNENYQCPSQESKKVKKKDKSNINSDPTHSSEDPTKEANQQDDTESKKKKKNKKQKATEANYQKVGDSQQNNKAQGNESQKNNNKQKRKQKFVNGEPVRRKPVNDNSFKLIINGKDIELVRFDGFPVMKKDAERLQELKTNMIKKGIPKSEVQRTLKLERRRAEKALARVKRDVCYNCRKGGHNLSDCPELKTKIPGVGSADGLCFKCGSTEHRQFECKVQKDKEFRFATCFICKEPGHIARQCPDNPKGLYPNGGSCKLCGDVTHLRKDCPTVQDKREDSSIKLQTLESAEYIEGITEKPKTTGEEQHKKPKKIKF